MDKLGNLKKALVAGVAMAALAAAPVTAPTSADLHKAAAEVEALSALPQSVQEAYRPVLKLSRLPDIPKQKGDRNWVWWQTQIKRCRFGWTAPDGHYLNGYQYFYLNFIRIPIQDKENAIAVWAQPYFRDNDEHIMSFLWRNTSRKLANGKTTNARNHVEAKCRSIGWTQISLLGVGMWTFIFKPDRQIGMGYSDDEVIDIERLWFQESWDRLHPMFRTWKGQMLEITYNNKDTFAVGYKDKANPKVVHTHNAVNFRIISDAAGVFKGLRLNLIIAIEAGKWKGDSLKNFYNENLDCLEMGDYKWGMFLIGGTSNAIVNKSSNYKEIYFLHETFNATRHFTPKTMVLTGYFDMDTGRSQTDLALIHILDVRKSKEGDPQSYSQYIIENPLTDQEAFTPNESFAYDTGRIQAHIAHLKANGFGDMWRRGRLEPEYDHTRTHKTGRIKFHEDPLQGKWIVNLQGLPSTRFKNLHVAGVDDTYKGAEEAKLRPRDSRNCMVIYRQPTRHGIRSDMPVAVFLHQTPDMDDIYAEFLKGLRYYDVQQCLYEYNHDGFVKYLRDNGESRRLFWVGSKPGISIKGKVKTELTLLGHTYIKEGRLENITCIPILEALLVWGSKTNTDIGSAFHLILHLLDATKDFAVTRREGSSVADEDESSRVVLGRQPEPAPLRTDVPGYPVASEGEPQRPTNVVRLGPQRMGSGATHAFPRTQYHVAA